MPEFEGTDFISQVFESWGLHDDIKKPKQSIDEQAIKELLESKISAPSPLESTETEAENIKEEPF